MTLATALSRVTGLVRVVVVAAAMGTTFLANTYQTANTAPNVVFELAAAGVLTSIFVPTIVDYIVRGRRDEGWDAVAALTSVALVGLIALAVVLGLAAPAIMRLLTLGMSDGPLRDREIALGATFLRLFAPQVVFYGVGMIMTAALHAHRRFGLAAAAPIANNLVVVTTYLVYALMRGDRSPTVSGITTAEVLVLGIGTTLGVVAMTAVLIPGLRRIGWRPRWHFAPRHPSVRRGLRLGAWGLGYAGGYQASLVVVLLLANKIAGGVAAYQWAYTFFYVPHALVAVPIFSVLFTAMAEHSSAEDREGLRARLHDGIGMLLFILIPAAAGLLVLSESLARAALQYGVMTEAGAVLVGRVLALLAVGLPGYSLFLVFTRAFYAVGDARTPALVNAGAAILAGASGAWLFAAAPAGWEVAGLAAGHTIGFSSGAAVAGILFARRYGGFTDPRLVASAARSTAIAIPAAATMYLVARLVDPAVAGTAMIGVLASGTAGASVYLTSMSVARAPELRRLLAMLPRRLRVSGGGSV